MPGDGAYDDSCVFRTDVLTWLTQALPGVDIGGLTAAKFGEAVGAAMVKAEGDFDETARRAVLASADLIEDLASRLAGSRGLSGVAFEAALAPAAAARLEASGFGPVFNPSYRDDLWLDSLALARDS